MSKYETMIDIKVNEKQIKKIKTLCLEITNALDKYLEDDEMQDEIETVTDSDGNVMGEFIKNRFNKVN